MLSEKKLNIREFLIRSSHLFSSSLPVSQTGGSNEQQQGGDDSHDDEELVSLAQGMNDFFIFLNSFRLRTNNVCFSRLFGFR